MKARVPLAVAVTLLFGLVAFTFHSVLAHTDGTYSYPIDDAFIHLAIARHLAFDRVYGITKYAFTSASSSVAWPFLLAAVDRLAGDHLLTPLVLNAVLALALVALFDRLLERESPGATLFSRTFWMATLVLLVPLPTLVLMGMEHVLQALATVWLVTAAARCIASEDRASPGALARIAIAAMVTCAARYEGLFVVTAVALPALARRRFSLAGAVCVAGLAPVLAFGAYSRMHGGLWLPNSVLLKGRSLTFRDMTDVGDFFFGDLVHHLSVSPHLYVLAAATLVLCLCAWRRDGLWSSHCCTLGIAAFATLAHVQMAGLGWFFRYEAYLVALDVVVIGLALTAWFPSPWAWLAGLRPRPASALAMLLAVVIVLGPLSKRALEATLKTPTACVNIYEQQVQSARFLAHYFPSDTVAINDIGAVAYYGRSRVVDVMGIATMEAARAKSFRLLDRMSTGDLARITRPASVAIVYDEWVGPTPSPWLRLGRWRIDHNQVCAFATVAIYATSPDEVARVLVALRSFSKQLPSGVHQEGRYTQPQASDGLYRLDAGDVLHVRFEGAPELGGTLKVQADGTLDFPKIGAVAVRGLSVWEAMEATRAHLANAKTSARLATTGQVELRLLQEGEVHTYAVGNVLRSGEFSTTTAPTVDFLLRVSGADPPKGADAFVLRENGAQFRRVALDAARAEGLLEHGDILVVR